MNNQKNIEMHIKNKFILLLLNNINLSPVVAPYRTIILKLIKNNILYILYILYI